MFISNSLRRLVTRRPSCPATPSKRFSTSPHRMDATQDSSFFSYTSGRFLFNEHLRLQERHVEFNVSALHLAAETSVQGAHGKVTKMSKLAEGGFNRVFTLNFEDGFEMIAKVPYHISKPEQLATASEVATLGWLRLQDIPVPEVYGYSYESENPVGTEYILMEKAPGVSLLSKWQDLSQNDMSRLAYSFVEIETKLFNLPLSATGSIYFKKDLDLLAPDLQAPLSMKEESTEAKQFCIGPIADYMFWYGRRKGLKLNRGPWPCPVDYLQSIAQKEIEWSNQFGRPREPDFPYNDIDEIGVQQPEDHVKLLRDYQKLAPHLLPKDPAHPSNQPILRHPDLNPSNIFVSADKCQVTCLIDWQHAVVQPRLLTAGHPPTFEKVDRQMIQVEEKPKLPENLLDLDAEEQTEVRARFRQSYLAYIYYIFTGYMNKEHLNCIQDPLLVDRQRLVDRASRQWSGNPVTLRADVTQMTLAWDYLPDTKDVKRPVVFTESEVDEITNLEQAWISITAYMEFMRTQRCGMSEQGWVTNEEYEDAKKKLSDVKEGMHSMGCGEEDYQKLERGWPWGDREEEE